MVLWDESDYAPLETEDFLVFAGEFAGSVQRWDEIRDAFWRALLHNPYIGAYEPDSGLWVQDLYSVPPLSVYYTIEEDAKTVTFRYIALMAPLEDD